MKFPTLLLLAVACASAQEASESSPESVSAPQASLERLDRCASLGFDVDALDCRNCDDLSSFLTKVDQTPNKNKKKEVDLVINECQKCCSDFSKLLEAEGRRYPKVVLAVSPNRLKRYPKVANFVEHQADKVKRLEVQETNFRLPMLQFFDEEGEKVEELSVAHWDEDSIAEFIGNKLLPDEEVKDGEGDEVEKTAEEEVVEVEVQADKP